MIEAVEAEIPAARAERLLDVSGKLERDEVRLNRLGIPKSASF